MTNKVNYEEILKNKQFPCPLCDRELNIMLSKHNKPYLICNSCGIQLFIRYEEGIKRLVRFVENPW